MPCKIPSLSLLSSPSVINLYSATRVCQFSPKRLGVNSPEARSSNLILSRIVSLWPYIIPSGNLTKEELSKITMFNGTIHYKSQFSICCSIPEAKTSIKSYKIPFNHHFPMVFPGYQTLLPHSSTEPRRPRSRSPTPRRSYPKWRGLAKSCWVEPAAMRKTRLGSLGIIMPTFSCTYTHNIYIYTHIIYIYNYIYIYIFFYIYGYKRTYAVTIVYLLDMLGNETEWSRQGV